MHTLYTCLTLGRWISQDRTKGPNSQWFNTAKNLFLTHVIWPAWISMSLSSSCSFRSQAQREATTLNVLSSQPRGTERTWEVLTLEIQCSCLGFSPFLPLFLSLFHTHTATSPHNYWSPVVTLPPCIITGRLGRSILPGRSGDGQAVMHCTKAGTGVSDHPLLPVPDVLRTEPDSS
jgi:hypothetical protein